MEPQTALVEKGDNQIEDESLPVGKAKDGDHIDNENLPALKAKCKGKKHKNLSIKDYPKPKKRSKTSALLKIIKQISTLEQTLNARMNHLEQSVWPPASNLNLYRLNKPDNLIDANSAENNTYDEVFGVDTRDQADPYDAVSLSGGDISEEESMIHDARSKFDHTAGLSPNNGDPPRLSKAEQCSTDKLSASLQKTKKGNFSHEEEDTKHYEFYDPTEEEPKFKTSEGFTKFLLTNFDRKLTQPQIDTMLEDCQPPDLDPCWAPKLDQDVTKQVPFEAKKILPRRDQDLHIIQKHMLAATGSLYVLHNMLENGECSKE